VDAAVIASAERMGAGRVATVDREDFPLAPGQSRPPRTRRCRPPTILTAAQERTAAPFRADALLARGTTAPSADVP